MESVPCARTKHARVRSARVVPAIRFMRNLHPLSCCLRIQGSVALPCYGIVTIRGELVEQFRASRNSRKSFCFLALLRGAAPSRAAPLPPRGKGRADHCLAWPGLRQVIAERGEDHVVHGLGANTWPGHTGRGVKIIPGPAHLDEVGVLHAPLHAALRALVELMPEADGAFDDLVDVAGAGGTAGCAREAAPRRSAGRNSCFGAASTVVKQGRTVAERDGKAPTTREGVLPS